MATDLFTWIDALYNKTQPEGTPPMYMIHRFLASDQTLSPVARELQIDIREPDILFGVWQALLPKGGGAPRFSYVAAKKPKAAEALTTKMMRVLNERREVVEDKQEILRLVGKEYEMYVHFGIEPPTEPAETTRATKKRGGLLG